MNESRGPFEGTLDDLIERYRKVQLTDTTLRAFLAEATKLLLARRAALDEGRRANE